MDKKVRLFNLQRQYLEHREEYIKAFDEVCGKAAYCDGDFVHLFEKEFAEFCSVKYASGVNSGTSSLFLAMKALGIGEGDEVIVPSMTFIASAWGAVYAGAKPVFVDSREDTWEIDAESIEKHITDKTKAIIGVHLYGMPFDFDEVKKVADKYNLKIVEDCAQAHGATYKGKRVGSLGDIGCFSFYPTKNLGAFGEGGCVVTDNEEYIERINFLKKHSLDNNGVHREVGYNMRMDGIQAHILSYKLKNIDEKNKRRAEIGKIYREQITNPLLTKQSISDNCEHVYHIFSLATPDRARFIRYMNDCGVECGQHYHLPCHLQEVFSRFGYKKGDLPVAEDIFSRCVTIPLYPELTDEEIEIVIDACNKFKV